MSDRKRVADMTTVEILEAFAQDHREMERPTIAAVLQERADRLREYVRMAGTPGANGIAAAAVRRINEPFSVGAASPPPATGTDSVTMRVEVDPVTKEPLFIPVEPATGTGMEPRHVAERSPAPEVAPSPADFALTSAYGQRDGARLRAEKLEAENATLRERVADLEAEVDRWAHMRATRQEIQAALARAGSAVARLPDKEKPEPWRPSISDEDLLPDA